jgi:hypothetical protein
MKNYRPYSISKIRSFRDLREEKLRLKAETMRIEERMQSNYSNIKEALSPANVLKSILLEITASAPWISGVYSIGQKIFAKKKKKKKAISVDSDNILP